MNIVMYPTFTHYLTFTSFAMSLILTECNAIKTPETILTVLILLYDYHFGSFGMG